MKLKLLSAAIACISASAYALEGQIVDSKGQAIEGAVVKVLNEHLSTTTNKQGYYKLALIKEDELHIIAPGFVHKPLHIEKNQINDTKNVVLQSTVIEQIDVIGIPLHASQVESAMPVNILAGDELRNKQAATLGDSLAQEVGINTSFYGNVASTPIIRGLSGPRVLITQNSLDVSDVSRIGPDHSVAAEVSTAEQIEVLRGPATLFYGSGAIGGVVNVVDKRIPTNTETEGEWLLSHDTVNDQDLASFNLNTGVENFAFHIDGFLRDSNDYDVPVSPEADEDHGERKVASSAEESKGLTLGTSIILDNGFVGFSYGRLDRDYGVPGHSHGDEEHHDDDDEHEEHDENAEMVTLGLKQDRYQILSELTFDNDLISGINTRIGYTDYEHSEFEDGSTGTTFTNKTSEVRFELLHQPIDDWNGALVFDYKNSKYAATGDEAFTPATKTNTYALALLEEKHFGDVLVQMGARIEQVNIESNNNTIPEIEFHSHDDEEHEDEHHEEEHEEEHHDEMYSFDESYTPYSLSLGAVWDFTPGYNVGISLSHSERAPSAAELLSYGPHIPEGIFVIGALFGPHEEVGELHFEPTGNKPEMEKSNNIDITFRKFEGDVGFIVNTFYNQIDNYYGQFDLELLAEAGHVHGEEEGEEHEGEEHEGEEDIHAGELPVYHFQQVDATLSGIEAQGIWQVNQQFTTTVFADYVRAKLDNGSYLPRIPPMKFGASLAYDYEQIAANVTWTHYSKQDNVATNESKTDGYDWVDANINYYMTVADTDLTLFFKAENLTDEEARVHSSVLKDLAPRPGRNFRIGIRGSF